MESLDEAKGNVGEEEKQIPTLLLCPKVEIANGRCFKCVTRKYAMKLNPHLKVLDGNNKRDNKGP